MLKLSEVARHFRVPSGVVSTGWPSVEAKLLQLGIRFDPWQVQAAKVVLAKRADGLFATSVGGVVWSIPRQVGKTFTVGSIVLALCLLEPEVKAIWTAHQLRTANETFRAMQGLCRREQVRPFVARLRMANGEGEIEFTNGSRVLFGARERGFGVGIANVSVLMLDEAQRASEKALEDLIPTLNQASNPLLFLLGTPPRPTDPGGIFRRRRLEALAGGDDMFYLEFGASADCDPGKWAPGVVDWSQVALANPSYPTRTPRAAILRMMRQLGVESFRREGLGLWDDDLPGELPLIDATVWGSSVAAKPASGLKCFGVRFAVDGVTVALGAAIRPPGGPIHVEVIDERPVTDGLGWLVEWLAPRAKTTAQVVVDGRSGVGALLPALKLAGVGEQIVLVPTVGNVIDAHAMFLDALLSGGITHSEQPGLASEVGCAQRRKIGVAGGWGWRSTTDEPVTGLEAVTLAAWSVATTKRRPGKKGGGIL
jgi:hypothetical protein